MSINKATLIGNVGIDPAIKHLAEDSQVANFTLATSETYKQKDGTKKTLTEWHNIVAWNGVAGIVEKYVHKGDQLYVEGKIKTRSYIDASENKHYITEIFIDTIQLLGKKPTESKPPDTSSDSNVVPPDQSSDNEDNHPF